jgi:CubicO group peptidase (beta-lactamase class C family)
MALGAQPINAQISLATTPGATPSSAGSAGLNADRFVEFMQMVGSRMADTGVPGVVVGVVDNEIRATCGLGVTNLEHPAQASAQTYFRAASLSTLFTGSAIGSLVDAGAVDLESPVRAYLPSFTVADPQASEDVLVRHLVTHSAGWHGTLRVDPGPGDDALARYVDHMAALPQVSRPGAHFSYNNAAVILAGHLIVEVTGQVFEDAMQDLTLSPLSMDGSSFSAADLRDKTVAFGHARDGNGPRVIDPWISVRAAAPVNGLVTNVDELLSFAAFHADATRSKPVGYLSEDTRMTSHRALGPGGSMGPLVLDSVGMNWMLTTIDNVEVSVHAANDFGQSSIIAVVPAKGFAVVILTNADAGQALSHELMVKALHHFLDFRQEEPEAIEIPEAGISDLAGRYQYLDGPTVTVAATGSGARLDVVMDGQPVPDLSGDLIFVAADRARLHIDEPAPYVDFVRDDGGAVAWLRLLGQLAPRTGR